jgi:ubiquinol-cytochrome c reductase cytochrome b subunit
MTATAKGASVAGASTSTSDKGAGRARKLPSPKENLAAGAGTYVDDRLHSANFLKRSLNKVFPDHWSFMLGEIALYSFIILLLSGTFLSFFFVPSQAEVIYNGSYVNLRGVPMSEAMSSTLDISFDVRGGLLMRQIHHWAALLFIAAMAVHLFRIFFTGAFRKPREVNWVIGVTLIVLGLLEGFAGYSLPDDLLSGTGLRIAQGIILAIPIAGPYVSYIVFGGEFPGDDFIPRLYTVHVLLIPGILLALITAHLMILWFQKHTQFPGPGRTEQNVVGYPLFPVYTAKAGGFFFVVFGVTAALGALAQINPIWLYGPYDPAQVSAGSQPDWYIGFLDGALRVMPNWEFWIGNLPISLNVLIPALVMPGIIFTAMALYPFIEQFATDDNREHHLLDRPRNQPTRTGIGVMGITFYTLLWINGGNDIIGDFFNVSINAITWTIRVTCILLPPLAFWITRRICLGLQRRDREKLLHGWETGQVKRMPSGEFIEVHAPISAEERAVLTSHRTERPFELPVMEDANGIRRPHRRIAGVRAKLSQFYFADQVEMPTQDELRALEHHNGHRTDQVEHQVEQRELTRGPGQQQ